MGLYESPSWIMDEPQRPREFVIHEDGEVLANITRVPLQRQDDPALPYANPHAYYDENRIVLCAAGPDGMPYFYVDRVRDPMRPRPSMVLAPDGSSVGSIAVKTGITSVAKLLVGRKGSGYALMDGYGRQVALLSHPPRSAPEQDGVIEDAQGAEVARFRTELSPHHDRRRRYRMRLHHAPAEPVRTLVLAALIGVELMIPAW